MRVWLPGRIVRDEHGDHRNELSVLVPKLDPQVPALGKQIGTVVQAGAERRMLGPGQESTRDVLTTIERVGRGAMTAFSRWYVAGWPSSSGVKWR